MDQINLIDFKELSDERGQIIAYKRNNAPLKAKRTDYLDKKKPSIHLDFRDHTKPEQIAIHASEKHRIASSQVGLKL